MLLQDDKSERDNYAQKLIRYYRVRGKTMVRNVGFIPYNNTTNKFIANTIQAIEMAGYNVVNGLKTTPEEMDCILLNWFESLPEGIIHRIYFLIKRIWLLRKWKKNNVRIISYFHNRRPHDSRFSLIDKTLIRYINTAADRIIILCEGSRKYADDLFVRNAEEKMICIPHPNYVGSYPDDTERSEQVSDTDKLRILFFGRVMPYKNIEMIIRAATDLKDEPVTFTITGNASEEYKYELLKKAYGVNNLVLDLRYIDDQDVSKIIRDSDLLLLPYAGSILNSGTAILAFSYGKTVIIPSIPVLDEYDPSLVYSFDGNEKAYYEQMIHAVRTAINDYKQDKESIRQKGEKLLETVNRDNSITVISQKYKDLFDKI